MLSGKRCAHPACQARSRAVWSSALTVTAAAAALTSRGFDFGGKQTTGSIPIPTTPRNGYAPGAPPRGLGLTEAPLPPPSETAVQLRPAATITAPRLPRTSAGRTAAINRLVGRTYRTPPPAQYDPSRRRSWRRLRGRRRSISPRESERRHVEVQPGETLYSIARRTGIPVAASRTPTADGRQRAGPASG